VALSKDIPAAIGTLLAEDREPIAADQATTAVFYSISNCQEGLRGVSFGNFLIKQVVEDLKRELPGLNTFVTLSPVPGFAGWLARERADEASSVVTAQDSAVLALLDQPDWDEDADKCEAVRAVLMPIAATYMLRAKTPSGKPADPVARFHLGNGARLERLNFLGDLSPRGMRQAHGLMVNYLYKLDDIETNHERFADKGEVVAATAVRKLLRSDPAAAKSATDKTKASKPQDKIQTKVQD